MFQWRITKYNPKYRDEKGVYTRDEWTSISDVGSVYKITSADYIAIENKYVEAVVSFMEYLQIKNIFIRGLEKRNGIIEQIKKFPGIYPQEMINLFSSAQENLVLDKNLVAIICRLILREHLWCKLVSADSNFFVHFGYDFYMYIGSVNDCSEIISGIEKTGLFVEKFESPYNNKYKF